MRTGPPGRGLSFADVFTAGRPRVSLPAALVVCLAFSTPAAQNSPPQPRDSQEKTPEKTAGQDPTQATGIPLPKGKKLFLKDGNFHLVRSHERKGDRVRYYSVERSSWEEIPAELVDWEATRKAEAEDARRSQELIEKMRSTQAAERAAGLDVDASIEIAPGVFLPEGEGLYVVEGRMVWPLAQASADLKLDKKRLLTQVLVPIPVVPTRHRVQIPGKRAEQRITTPQPEFFVRTADAREPNMELVRAQVKGEARQLEILSTYITGDRTSKRETVSVQSWKVAKGVYRLTLSQSLEAGEYAMAEILPEGMNLYVWDFGVDPPARQPGSVQQRSGQATKRPPGKVKR